MVTKKSLLALAQEQSDRVLLTHSRTRNQLDKGQNSLVALGLDGTTQQPVDTSGCRAPTSLTIEESQEQALLEEEIKTGILLKE
jgi:hypothetical protein